MLSHLEKMCTTVWLQSFTGYCLEGKIPSSLKRLNNLRASLVNDDIPEHEKIFKTTVESNP